MTSRSRRGANTGRKHSRCRPMAEDPIGAENRSLLDRQEALVRRRGFESKASRTRSSKAESLRTRSPRRRRLPGPPDPSQNVYERVVWIKQPCRSFTVEMGAEVDRGSFLPARPAAPPRERISG